MPRFEILIPKGKGIATDLHLQMSADDWLSALKAGLAKVGEDGAVTENVLCDIKQDNSIHVSDTTTGRVFRIKEITEQGSQATREDQYTTIPEMPGVEDTAVTIPEMQADPERQAMAQPTATSSGIGRAIDFTSEATADLLEDVFDLSQKVSDQSDRKRALYYILDLAMNTVGTDSGSVFLADINTNELEFGAARGPKADEVMGFKIKMGQGIVGFCAETAVGMAVSDTNRDPRFYKKISEKIGYATNSILCVPVQTDGQVFGALELINKKSESTFTQRDLGVANFLGQQLARHLKTMETK